MEWLLLLAGLVTGGLAAWLLGKAQARDSLGIVKEQIAQKDEEIIRLRELYDTERVEHAGLKARFGETEKHLAAQKQFLEESQKTLSNAFEALSKEALGSNNEMFLQLAKSNLEKLVTDAKGDFSKKQEAIDKLLTPLNESLKEYDKQVRSLAETVQKDYGSVDQHLKTVKLSTESLQKETGQLVQALRAPQVRGRWGELTLRRVAELAGMVDKCDFFEQVSVDSGRLRPDMVVNLPGGRTIVVDSKVSLTAYLDMLAATTDDERKEQLARHAGQVRTHMRALASKEYWSQFSESPDFVVMFIPAESFFSAAMAVDPDLIEDGIRNNIVLTSPTGLIALIRTIALGWRQEKFAENAARVSAMGADLYDRISVFVRNFSRVGKSLESATDAFNKSVGSLESRVLVSARRFKELGATAQSDIPEVEQIEKIPRSVTAEPEPDDRIPRSVTAEPEPDDQIPRSVTTEPESNHHIPPSLTVKPGSGDQGDVFQ